MFVFSIFKSQIRELTLRYHTLLIIPHLIQHPARRNPGNREDDVSEREDDQPDEADVEEGHPVEADRLLGLCGEALQVDAALKALHLFGDYGELPNDGSPFLKLVVILVHSAVIHVHNILRRAHVICHAL